jgi:hypothetical protein
MLRLDLGPFAVHVPAGWEDITDVVQADAPPYTLARRDGVGALQFSIALYKSGRVPNPTAGELQKMVETFGVERRLGEASEFVTETGPPVLAAGTFKQGGDSVRVWRVSDGRNFALVTYTCAARDVGPELVVCEDIVRSIEFRAG